MKATAPADLQRWSEELARNPASLSFLPLARAHRRNGRRDLALRVCTRGLEHHPGHVEAHALLALLYLEEGDRDRAADEWSIVLRLKPGNFEALRGMGFRHLEQNDLMRARQHLERAALIRPSDATVQEALRILRQRQEGEARAVTRPPAPPPPPPTPAATAERPPAEWPAGATAGPPPDPDWLRPRPPSADSFPFEIVASPDPRAPVPDAHAGPMLELENVVEEGRPPAEGRAAAPERTAPARTPPPARTAMPSPGGLFDDMLQGSPLLGALLLDRRGLVLAGSLRDELSERTDELGAILGGAIDDAIRTAAHLELGTWRVMLLETRSAVVHISPVGERGILALAATHAAPTGWILRTAAHAADRAAGFLAETS